MPFSMPTESIVEIDLRENEEEDYAIKPDYTDYKISFIKRKEDPSTEIASRVSVGHFGAVS